MQNQLDMKMMGRKLVKMKMKGKRREGGIGMNTYEAWLCSKAGRRI